MMRPRVAAKGGKLEKPRPLRNILKRSISETLPKRNDEVDSGTGSTKTEICTDTVVADMKAREKRESESEMGWLTTLVSLLEENKTSMIHVLDLCTLLQDRGARLEKDQPDWMCRCFAAVRLACKRDSMDTHTRLLLLDLLELRARSWRKLFSPVFEENGETCSKEPATIGVKKVPVEDGLHPEFSLKPSLTSPVDAHSNRKDYIESALEDMDIRWDPSSLCWQCELVLSDINMDRVCAISKNRLHVIELLTSTKIILTKMVVKQRQLIIRGKQDDIRKAARLLLDVVNERKAEDIDSAEAEMRNGMPPLSPVVNTPTGHHSHITSLLGTMEKVKSALREQDMNCNIHTVPNENQRPAVPADQPAIEQQRMVRVLKTEDKEVQTVQHQRTENKQVQTVHLKVTDDKEVQTESSNLSSVHIQPAATKWEQQCLLQFPQGTLCLMAQEKAVLMEAKELLREHFCPVQKRQDLSSESQKCLSDHSANDETKLKRSRSEYERDSTSRSIRRSAENSFADRPNLCRSQSETVGLSLNNSTPDRSRDSPRLPFVHYDSNRRMRGARGDDSTNMCKSADSTFEEHNPFNRELLIKNFEEHVNAISTPDVSPDASPVASTSLDCSGFKMVQITRQPIMPGCTESDLELLENGMPSGLYTPRGRRAMFKRYTDQVLNAPQFGGVQFQTSECHVPISYSWGELLSCASSPVAQTCPSDWSYLAYIFPEVCLNKVSSFFDPAWYAEQMASERLAYPHGKVFWQNRSEALSTSQRDDFEDSSVRPCQIRGQ